MTGREACPDKGRAPWVNDHDADFTAYGRLLTNIANLPTNNPTTTLNSLMTNMCTTIKANNVVIYTILFNSGTAPTKLPSTCLLAAHRQTTTHTPQIRRLCRQPLSRSAPS